MPEQWVGGGGTRFTAVFDWVANQGHAPGALIYFTDAMGEFPEREPEYPVLWLVKGRGKVPWGNASPIEFESDSHLDAEFPYLSFPRKRESIGRTQK